MTSSATRPPWLYKERELEEFVGQHNPSLNISDLKRSRNDCQLVNNVLNQIVSRRGVDPPGEWEMNVARIHLAVDLQNILKRWCCIGLQKTLDGSVRHLFSPEIFPSELSSPVRKFETTTGVTKVEVTSPTGVFPEFNSKMHYPGFQTQSEAWNPYHRSGGVSAVTRTDSLAKPRSSKRSLEDADQYPEATKIAKTDKSTFLCPFHLRNPQTHVECADKTFPNPRKLKEHVWRFLKPFKCHNCGEGFGREKTRAIHCEQRKTKCTKAPSSYEGSPDHRRDHRIETAKSTQEMIEIFDMHEKEKELPQSHGLNSTVPNNSMRFPADRRSSSPDSQNGSSNDSSDSTSDNEQEPSGDRYMDATPGLCSIIPSTENCYASQQQDANLAVQETPRGISGFPDDNLGLHDSDRCNRHRGLSLNPSSLWGQVEGEPDPYNELNRTQSAPPYSSTSSTYQQPPPQIIITQAELNHFKTMSQSTSNQQTGYGDNSMSYSNPEDDRGNSFPEGSMEEFVMEQRGFFMTENRGSAPGPMMHNERSSDTPHVSVPIVSNGFGSVSPFSFRMNGLGIGQGIAGADSCTY